MSTTSCTRRRSTHEQAEHTLSGFCTACPDPAEVTQALKTCGFELAFSMPAERRSARYLKLLPAQYHYEHQSGAHIEYLAGEDLPGLSAGERDDAECVAGRPPFYPPHASRFWLTPGTEEVVAWDVQDVLNACWSFTWLDPNARRARQDAA